MKPDYFDCSSCPGGDIGGPISASPECILCHEANCEEHCLDDAGSCVSCEEERAHRS